MWPQNDGTFITPQGQHVSQGLQQLLTQPGAMPSSSQIAQVNHGDNSNVNPPGPDEEIEYFDSEFDEDCSELDEEDSDPENEAILASHLMHQNAYASNSAYMESAAQSSHNYSALNALGQLSTSVAPTSGMMQGQNVNAADHNRTVIAALSGLTASAAPASNMQSQQKIQNSNHNAVSAQHAMAMAQWQHHAQQVLQAQYMQQQAQLAANGYKSGDKNGNNNKGDAVSDDKRKEAIKPPPKNIRQSTPNRMSTSSRGGGIIRPRIPPYRCRNESGIDLFELRRREFEETLTTEDESASSSPIKNIKAKLKHLKILNIFRRNKNSRDTLVTISPVKADLPSLRDTGNCSEPNQDEGKSQLQKISEVLLKPSEKASVWISNNEDNEGPDNTSNLIANHSSSYEKSIQTFLFRSNFPEHFLAIRLQQLTIDDVQQLIREIDLLENVQDKLTEMVRTESLSGPALMSCDLSELKKSLDLNLGHWTIFEQLITGLRHIQFDDSLKLNIAKQTRISQEIYDDDPNSQCTSLSSGSQSTGDGKKKDTGGEDAQTTPVGVGALNSSATTLP